MIRYGQEVQGLVALRGAAEIVDAFAARKPISRVRIDLRAEEYIGIEGLGGV